MSESSKRSIKGTVIAASSIFVLDAFALNQGAIAVIAGLVTLVLGLYALVFSKASEQRSYKIKRGVVWCAGAVAVLSANWANNHIARHRADQLVLAVKAYHIKHDKYPLTLNDLVPEYASQIPIAKYTLAFNHFTYLCIDGKALLFYTSLPPFGRPTYSFRDNHWLYLD